MVKCHVFLPFMMVISWFQGNEMKTNKQPTINRYLLDNKTTTSSRTLQITSFAPLLQKPARLVARVTDDTSVQRRYRAAWRPNKQFPSTIPERLTTATDKDTKRHILGERILTVIITLLVVIFSTLHLSLYSRATFQAGSLLLSLASVYILLYSIIFNSYIVDVILYIIKMATCSLECLEAVIQMLDPLNSLLIRNTGLSLAVMMVLSMIGGVILWHGLSMIWHSIQYRNIPANNPLGQFMHLNDLAEFDSKVLKIVYKRISNPEILIDLGLALNINLEELEALQYENSNIRVAGFYVLMRWYKKQDGLSPESASLQKLKDALSEAKLGKCVWEINNLVQDQNR